MNETRGPRVFATDDPNLVADDDFLAKESAAAGEVTEAEQRAAGAASSASVGGIFVSAVAALASLAVSVSFARFVSTAIERNDWIGWTATSLAAIAAVCAAIIVLREIVGLVRLGRLARIRRDVQTSLKTNNRVLERKAVRALKARFRGRDDLAWGLARLREHERAVSDPGDLLKLADRELLAPIDVQARRAVLKSAKRVSVVTAMSPMVWVAMLYVVVENLRMLRTLGGLYGGRPGGLGALRLARMVMTHLVATGGLAMTDDLLGQFLGQDLLRRLSRRLGEGAFNGALTARVGTAAIEVTRPLPFLDTEPVRARDLLPELLRRTVKDASSSKQPGDVGLR